MVRFKSLVAASLLAVFAPHGTLARRRRARGRDVRGRVLLVRGVGFRCRARCGRDNLRVHRRDGRQPDVQAGLRGRHGASRGGADPLRPGAGLVRTAAAYLLAQRRPDRRRRAVLRPRRELPDGDLRRQRGGAAPRRSIEGGAGAIHGAGFCPSSRRSSRPGSSIRPRTTTRTTTRRIRSATGSTGSPAAATRGCSRSGASRPTMESNGTERDAAPQ